MQVRLEPRVQDRSAPSIVRLLRERCAPAHTRLEARFARFEWLATRETYAAMLERLYAFYGRAEPAIGAVATAIPGLELDERRKAPLLAADLRSLGFAPAQPSAHALPIRLPRLDTPARALGALYVLEGATLGGKLIEREVGRRLGFDRTAGTAFFGAYGSDAMRYWRRFGLVLEREAVLLDPDEMCDAAAATFEALDRVLVT
jgi:heme oxygenase